jgi:endo-1,4-beta-D-glucanase Y
MSFHRPTSIKASFAAAAAAVALAAGCASGGGGGSGSAGTNGSGQAGTTGQAGSSGAGAGLGTGGPVPFPQNKTSGACMLTTVANAASSTQSAYNSWKSTFVVGGNPGLRVQRPENQNDTVSEGIGYGMLAAVYMGDQQTFDGLWTYAQAHLDPKGLMNWHISAGGSTIDAYSATDGDEDIVFALLMASDQWSGTDYLTPAKAMITAMRTYSLFTDGTLQNGDNYNTADQLNIDYFSPAYYRVFAKATGDTFWSHYVVDSNYDHLAALTGTYGLVPDSSNLEHSTTCQTCKAQYGYDACRMPWRIAMDYCFNNETRAHDYLTKIGGFFNNIGGGPGNICDSYNANGTQGNTCNHNLAFIGPAGVSGMAGFPNLVNNAFNLMVNPPQGNQNYFPQSLRVLSMLMMSGNFLDYSQLQ